jgi:hypothetical protein
MYPKYQPTISPELRRLSVCIAGVAVLAVIFAASRDWHIGWIILSWLLGSFVGAVLGGCLNAFRR